MTVSENLFGTDGIRGQVSLAEVDEEEAVRLLAEERTLTPALVRVLGEALGATMPLLAGEGSTVVIGWDDRPANATLARALTLGLRLNGATVVHIGLCATPTLHAATLAFDARMGCMITASHNPVTDSGVKVFDGHGYKSTRPFERDVSSAVWGLSQEDREVDEDLRLAASQPNASHTDWPAAHHPALIKRRWTTFEAAFGGFNAGSSRLQRPFLIDGAKGFASTWLAAFLNEQGLNAQEVSSSAAALNDRCGAGDLSPTQTWTFEEAAASDHALVSRLQPAPAGRWMGAALDGDGDRCLVIESTDTGFKVVDGDAMAAALLGAGSVDRPWTFAASIESDVALMGHVQSLHSGTVTHETGVGDRWLSMCLRPTEGGWWKAPELPALLGVEDSGHVVMASPHPNRDGTWALVGDGAATLCALLCSLHRPSNRAFLRGWKSRVSVKDAHRERWQADNALFNATKEQTLAWMRDGGFEAEARTVEGEDNLLLVQGMNAEGTVSLGVRNSGTQAKTSLSLRLSPGLEPKPFQALLNSLHNDLMDALT